MTRTPVVVQEPNTSRRQVISTKIYNGLIMRNCDLHLAYHRLTGIKPGIQKQALQLRIENVVRAATVQVDKLRYKAANNRPIINQYYPLSQAYHKAIDEEQEVRRTGGRNPLYDMHFEVSLFPLPMDVLVLPFCDNRTLLPMLTECSWLEEFGYWDNADPEEGISEVDWASRRTAWEVAMGPRMIPSDLGLTFTFVPEAELWLMPEDPEQILAAIPRDDERLRTLAYDTFLATAKERIRDRPENAGATIMGLVTKAMDYIRNEGADELAEWRENLRPMIRPISIEELRRWN